MSPLIVVDLVLKKTTKFKIFNNIPITDIDPIIYWGVIYINRESHSPNVNVELTDKFVNK